MNFWNFAIAHPIATTIFGVSVVFSGLGVGISFARNKTPIIGCFSPSFSLNIGKQEAVAADINNIGKQEAVAADTNNVSTEKEKV